MYRAGGRQARRCRDCGARFYAGAGQDPAATPAKPKQQPRRKSRFRLSSKDRKLAIQVALFLGLLLIFLVFLRFITQERGGGGEGRLTPRHEHTA